jgi:hypothetical protein
MQNRLLKTYTFRWITSCCRPDTTRQAITYSISFSKQKRKYILYKVIAKLRDKRTSITTVQSLLLSFAISSTTPISHWSVPLKCNCKCKKMRQIVHCKLNIMACGAANTKYILTLFLNFWVYVGGNVPVPPKGKKMQTGSTKNHISLIFLMLAAPKYWCEMVSTLLDGTNVRLNWNIESDMNVYWI